MNGTTKIGAFIFACLMVTYGLVVAMVVKLG